MLNGSANVWSRTKTNTVSWEISAGDLSAGEQVKHKPIRFDPLLSVNTWGVDFS